MAVLNVKFDNILCFDNFEANFTYPKKLVKTTLENEYLSNYPNFRYRKLNVIVGSNATGKTSLISLNRSAAVNATKPTG